MRTIEELKAEQVEVINKITESGMPRTFDRDLQVNLLRGNLRVLEGLEIAVQTIQDLLTQPIEADEKKRAAKAKSGE